ncbi:MAG: hypothetical protein VXA98_04610, partial [Gammaproteobacteria bacterium]
SNTSGSPPTFYDSGAGYGNSADQRGPPRYNQRYPFFWANFSWAIFVEQSFDSTHRRPMI